MRISYSIPQKWNDLTDWQLRRIGKLMHKRERVSHRFFISMLVSILLMPKRSVFGYVKSVILFWNVPLFELEAYCSFIFNEKLTRYPAEFKIGKKKFIGPAARLANSSIDELSYADTFFFNWANENNEQDLHRLAAVLYREEDPNASLEDKRAPFNKLLLPNNAEFTDKISVPDKLIIALAYQGCRELFAERHPVIFPKPPKEEEESEFSEKQKPKKKPKYQPFSKIIQAMAMDEVQVFGTIQETEKANAAQFFKIYEESIIRQRERERAQAKSK